MESTQFSVSLLKPSTWSNPQWDYVCKSPTISNVKSDLGGIVEKINNFNLSSESLWQNIRKSLVFCDETNLLRKDVVKYHIEGIKTLNVVDMPRFNEAVHQVYTFFMKILYAFDIAVLLEYSCIRWGVFVVLPPLNNLIFDGYLDKMKLFTSAYL